MLYHEPGVALVSDPLGPDGFPKPQDNFDVQQNPFVSPVAEESRGEGYKTTIDEPLNPWFSMWLKPRATVRQQLDTDPKRYVLLLAAIAGASNNLDQAIEFAEPIGSFFVALIVVLVCGAIGGLIWLYLGGWLIGITGRSLGGVGRAAEVRTAMAWSNIPTVWMLPLSLAFIVYAGLTDAAALIAIEDADANPLSTVSVIAWVVLV